MPTAVYIHQFICKNSILLLVKKRLLHYWNTFLKYVMLVQVHNVRGRQMTVITLAYCCHIRDSIRLNLILYEIKYWSNLQNCLCQKIVLKNFLAMERRRIILLQLKLHILQLGQ